MSDAPSLAHEWRNDVCVYCSVRRHWPRAEMSCENTVARNRAREAEAKQKKRDARGPVKRGRPPTKRAQS